MYFFRLNFRIGESASYVHFYYAGETSPTLEEFILVLSSTCERVTDAALLDDLKIIAGELCGSDTVFPMIKNPGKLKSYGWTYLSEMKNVMMEIELISFSMVHEDKVFFINETDLVDSEDESV